MKRTLFLMFLLFGIFSVEAQSCEEIMEYVKSKDYGTSYTSYDSDAISKVTFYSILIDYQTHYFAIVCFKKQYSYNCAEYIYRVAYDTKINYSMNYLDSAGKAFWKYIQPYNKNLGCAPDFE
jgi:hypothetical protein